MTIKQRVLIGSMMLGFTIINVTIVFLSHSLHAHVGILISFLGSVIFVIGRLAGYLEQKWERDKEFAKIIADRLLDRRDTNNSSSQNGQQMNALNNAGHMNTMLSLLGRGSGALSSTLGYNPVIGDGASSKYPGTQG